MTTGGAPVVRARIPWRRRDETPERKALVVVDGRNGHEIRNVVRLAISRESGDIAFQPTGGPGIYYVYYLPYRVSRPVNYPKVDYPEWRDTADAAWSASVNASTLPEAEFVGLESVDEFDRFIETETIATAAETGALLAHYPNRRYLVFLEDRSRPIRMTRDLPRSWVERGPGQSFRGSAAPGEFYTFQLGVWAVRAALNDVRVSFGAAGFRCFNQGGIDWQSRPFRRVVNVEKGSVQPVWCGVTAPGGGIDTTITVTAAGEPETRVPFHLEVGGEPLRNAGDDDPSRLSRLRWLDSTLAVDDGIVPPYTPVRVEGRNIGVLGREIVLGPLGLPDSIRSYFDIEMTHLAAKPRELLAGPVELVAKGTGPELRWAGDGVQFTNRAEGVAAWVSRMHAGPLRASIDGSAEFDGNVEFSIALSAKENIDLDDVLLEIPLRVDVARYAMGLGLKGGRAPESFDWKWDVEHNQDSAWIGDVNAGLQFSLHDDRYSRPLNTNFYLS